MPPEGPRPGHRATWSGAAALCAALALSHVDAHAQTDSERATRIQLLERATAAREAGRHVEALADAERAGRIEMTAGVRAFIAEEQLALGRYAAAFSDATACVREVANDTRTTLANRQAIQSTCARLVATLQERVGHLVVRVPEGLGEDGRVTLGGEALNPALYGTAVVVVAGPVEVAVLRAGRPVWSATVTVRARETENVRVDYRPAPESPPVAAAPILVSAPHTDARVERPSSTRRVVGWTLGATGAALLVTGLVTDLVGLDLRGRYNDSLCDAVASPRCVDDHDTLARLNVARLVGYIGGAALVGVGATLLLIPSGAPSARRAVRCAPGLLSIACEATF